MIPYFNAGIFLENKQQIGKVDEILGPMKQYVRINNLARSNLIIIYFLFSGSQYHCWKI
jgi:rRNA processing protein Gar1